MPPTHTLVFAGKNNFMSSANNLTRIKPHRGDIIIIKPKNKGVTNPVGVTLL